MAGGDPVYGVSVTGDLGAAIFQLMAKSYRPRPGGQRRLGQLREPLPEFGGSPTQGPQSRSPAAA